MGEADHWFPGAKVAETFDTVDKDALAAACTVGGWKGQEVVDRIAEAVDLIGGKAVKRQSQGG